VRIRFVGHASVALEAGGVVVLTDPWTQGLAFNDSWEAYPPPVLDAGTLERVTHLWVSHEHPDHLSIPTLRSIPESRRGGIALLYQRHWSREVVDFLAGMGFARVVELGHGEAVALGDGVTARLHQVGHEDSALTVHDGRHTVMDLNDCKPARATLRRMLRQVGPVDVLLDQFSIAGWPGNPDDGARLRAAGRETLDTFAAHTGIVRPRWVVPFASFVRFCHEENAFMNAAATPAAAAAAAAARAGAPAALLYPGDVWDLDAEPAGSVDAAARYAADAPALAARPLVSHGPVEGGRVLDAARARLGELARSFHAPLLKRSGPVAFDLTDAPATLLVAGGGARLIDGAPPAGASVVRLSSQAAWYAFAHRWGLSTLLISGRFAVHGSEEPWRRLKQLGSAHAQGIRTKRALPLLADRRVLDNVRRRWPDLYRDVVRRAA
jgi:UDP-MurNAc hydroxylase